MKAKKFPKVTKVWTKRDGTKIRICDMTDDHLINTIRMLERNARIDRENELNAALSVAGTLQGEMALDAINREINVMLDDVDGERFMHPLYDDLILDAQRRGLKI